MTSPAETEDVTGPAETATETTSPAETTTPPAATRAPLTRLQRVAGVGFGVVAGFIVLLLAVCLLFPALSIPSERLVSWRGGPPAGPVEAQTARAIRVEANRPGCVSDARAWLAPPTVTYTPWAVIITLHTSDAFESTSQCPRDKPDDKGRLPIVGYFLSGYYVDVHLSEPRGGRMLLDGSEFPPAPRPW